MYEANDIRWSERGFFFLVAITIPPNPRVRGWG